MSLFGRIRHIRKSTEEVHSGSENLVLVLVQFFRLVDHHETHTHTHKAVSEAKR